MTSQRTRNLAYAGALLGLIGVFGALPWYFTRDMKAKHKNLMLSEAPLGGHQIMRGPVRAASTRVSACVR